MAYCPNCGTKDDEDSMFCTSCGTNLGIDIKTVDKIINAADKNIKTPDKTIDRIIVKTDKTINKYKLSVKTLVIIIGIAIIISASLIFLSGKNDINRYSNAEDPIVVSDKDTMTVSDGNNQIASNQETAEVSISSIPSGANIYINNISKGKAPATINLPDGQYSLRMNITGYKSIVSDFNVTIKPNQDTEIILNATLEPEPINEYPNSNNTTNSDSSYSNESTNSNSTNETYSNESTNSVNSNNSNNSNSPNNSTN